MCPRRNRGLNKYVFALSFGGKHKTSVKKFDRYAVPAITCNRKSFFS